MSAPPARRAIEQALVVVPAANEEATVDAAMHAIAEAVTVARLSRPQLRTTVVVTLDRCTDATADIVARRPDVRAVRSDAGQVGAARARGTAHALAVAGGDPARTWTAHTDADSTVPPDWLAHQLDQADAGIDLVLGTVLPDLDRHHWPTWAAAHDPHDLHPHVHGANLGIRADVLLAVGGWHCLPEHEDVDLVDRVLQGGHLVARTGRIPVRTSGRTTGRTPGGMAGYLRAMTVLPAP